MRRGRRPSVKEPAAREVQHAHFFSSQQNSRARRTTEHFSFLFHRIGGLIIRQISRASQQRNFLATRRKIFSQTVTRDGEQGSCCGRSQIRRDGSTNQSHRLNDSAGSADMWWVENEEKPS
jgi:hypothetical protein